MKVAASPLTLFEYTYPMQERILVVDDEPKIVKLAADYLLKDGFRVLTAHDGLTALAVARREQPDLVVLDLMLPGLDGWEVCRALRRESAVPIIMLTARADETDQVAGLELGADDYVTKPFSPRALLARVRALLRRSQGRLEPPSRVSFAGLEMDLNAHTAAVFGAPLRLTPNEFKLLALLAQSPGQTFSRDQLLDALHGQAYSAFDRSVDSHIKNLRRKLEAAAAGPQIETVYAIGYRLAAGE
jgi:two-component system alkaline phosphatase synthesis response regulator PhoP